MSFRIELMTTLHKLCALLYQLCPCINILDLIIFLLHCRLKPFLDRSFLAFVLLCLLKHPVFIFLLRFSNLVSSRSYLNAPTQLLIIFYLNSLSCFSHQYYHVISSKMQFNVSCFLARSSLFHSFL